VAGAGEAPRPGLLARVGRALVLPLLTEPVDVATALPAEEVVRRMDARTRGGWRLLGRGIAVRHWELDGYRLVERSDRPWPARPRAFVRVVAGREGARVQGVLRATLSGRLLYAGLPVACVLLVAGGVAGGSDLWMYVLYFPVLLIGTVAFVNVAERRTLRAYLDEVVEP